MDLKRIPDSANDPCVHLSGIKRSGEVAEWIAGAALAQPSESRSVIVASKQHDHGNTADAPKRLGQRILPLCRDPTASAYESAGRTTANDGHRRIGQRRHSSGRDSYAQIVAQRALTPKPIYTRHSRIKEDKRSQASSSFDSLSTQACRARQHP